MSVGEIAVATGRKESTIRTHVKHMFAKHGLSRQAELVRLVRSLAGSPPTSTLKGGAGREPRAAAGVVRPVPAPNSSSGRRPEETEKTFDLPQFWGRATAPDTLTLDLGGDARREGSGERRPPTGTPTQQRSSRARQ